MPIASVGAAVAATPASPSAAPGPGRTFGAALRAHAPPTPRTPATAPGAARLALGSVERARERLDAVLTAARRGRTFTAQELLALQADAYRYSQTIELASKVVEQGTQAVKQAVHTQV